MRDPRCIHRAGELVAIPVFHCFLNVGCIIGAKASVYFSLTRSCSLLRLRFLNLLCHLGTWQGTAMPTTRTQSDIIKQCSFYVACSGLWDIKNYHKRFLNLIALEPHFHIWLHLTPIIKSHSINRMTDKIAINWDTMFMHAYIVSTKIFFSESLYMHLSRDWTAL